MVPREAVIQPIELDAILELFAELRLANFRVDVRHIQQVRDVIAAAAASGVQVQDRTRLRNWIAPIVCHSLADQREFARIFDAWAAAAPSPASIVSVASASNGERELRNTLDRAEVSARRWIWLIAIPALFLCLLAWAWLWTFSDTVGQSPTGGMRATTAVETKSFWLEWGGWGLALLLAGATLWVALWFRFAQRFLVRETAAAPRSLTALSVETRAQKLYDNLDVTRLASTCRRREVRPGVELDVAATVDNTIRHGGFFAPVFADQRVFPEYLALIDRTSHEDQQTAFVDELLNHLAKRGVYIERYYFDRDPRLCFPQRATDDASTLSLLASHFRDYRLLVFADTRVLANPSTGGIAAWVHELERWPIRALLVPGGARWTRFEHRLADHIPILPATLNGIASMLDGLHGDRRPRRSGSRKAPMPLPDEFAANADRWVGPAPLEDEQSASMIASLRSTLTPHEFTWLSACAVYPGMHWNLTLALGYGLEQRAKVPLVTTSSVASLAQLPWFRHGYMPDWLRRQLVDKLPRAENRAIRRILNALLMTAVRGGTGDLALQIVAEPSNTFERLAGFVRRIAVRRDTAPTEWRDQIFMRYMSPFSARSLAVRVPDAWGWVWGSVEDRDAITVPRTRDTRNTRLLAASMHWFNFLVILWVVRRTDRDRFLRFNAIQALTVALTYWIPVSLALFIYTPITMGGLMNGWLVVSTYLTFKAWRGQPARIPLFSHLALYWTRCGPAWRLLASMPLAPSDERTGPPWEELGASLHSFRRTIFDTLFAAPSMFRNMRRDGGIGRPFAFYLICAWISVLVQFFWEWLGLAFVQLPTNAEGVAIAWPLLMRVAAVVPAVFLYTVTTHLGLLRGRRYPLGTTFRTMAYAIGSASMIAVLPWIGGLLAWGYGLITAIIGLKYTQETSTWRAIVAVLALFVLMWGSVFFIYAVILFILAPTL
jgi:hypothetical protein